MRLLELSVVLSLGVCVTSQAGKSGGGRATDEQYETLVAGPDVTLFQYHVTMGDLDEIKKYVMEGRDIFAEDARGHCALDAAVITPYDKDQAVLKYLIGMYQLHNKNLDRVDFKGRTAIYSTCRIGYMEALKILFEAGADPTLKAEDRQCKSGYCDCLGIARAVGISRGEGQPHFGGHPKVVEFWENQDKWEFLDRDEPATLEEISARHTEQMPKEMAESAKTAGLLPEKPEAPFGEQPKPKPPKAPPPPPPPPRKTPAQLKKEQLMRELKELGVSEEEVLKSLKQDL